MKRNSLEILDAKNILVKRNLDILATAKKEQRELTDEESQEFDKNEEEIKALDEENEELEKELENKEENKNTDENTMEKKSFSISKEIREARKTGKQIQFRAGEPNYSVTANGEDVVETEVFNILEPLEANLVFTKIGAHYIGNLTGDVQIPIMTSTSVFWEDEVAEAQDGSGSLTNITLSPKRLTAKVPISLQMLAQDSQGIDSIIMNNLIKRVSDKIEATVLGYGAGSSKTPAGLFNGATLTGITTYNDLCNFEAEVEDENVSGPYNYVVTPKAKAYLRGLIKGNNNTSMVWDNEEIDGTPAAVTTNLAAAENDNLGVLFGNFDDLYVATWGDVRIDVVEDSYTLSRGQIMLIVNFFCDVKAAREESFAMGHIVEPEGD